MPPIDVAWAWDHHRVLGGWAGLGLLSLFSALVSGVAEALGKWISRAFLQAMANGADTQILVRWTII